MIPIFDATSSAEALNRIVSSGKKKASVRQISKRLGFASDRGLGMVLKGQRLASPALIQKVAQKYQIGPSELLFLNLLVQRERLKKRSLPTAAVDEKIRQIALPVTRYKKLEPPQLKALKMWWSLPVIELLRHEAHAFTAKEIHALLLGDLPFVEFRQNLEALAEAGMVSRDEAGAYFVSKDTYFLSSFDVPSASIREIHKSQLKRATDSLKEHSVLETEFITKTMAVPKSCLPQAKEIIRQSIEELSEKLHALALSQGGEHLVTQMGLQFFPQSRPCSLELDK